MKVGAYIGPDNFCPPYLPRADSPFIWLRADAGLTIETGVKTWANLSGAGGSPTQATGTKQPALVAAGGPNGMPCIRGDGSNDELFAAFTWNQPNHVWIVCKYDTVVDDRSVIDGSAVNAGRLRTTAASNDLFLTGGAQIGPLGVDIRNWHYIEVQLNGASSKFSADAGAYVAGNAGAAARGGISLFNSPSTGAFAAASIAEVIGFNGIQSAAVIARIQTYLHSHYGL